MPELPEVETTRRGIEPHLVGHKVSHMVIRQTQLRWPVPPDMAQEIKGQTIIAVKRRAKYLLLQTSSHCAIIHLGMSGSLRIVDAMQAAEKHDHVDLVLDTHQALRLRDPRKFGAVLWTHSDPSDHPLLANLGIEPLGPQFDGNYLFEHSRKKSQAVKTFLMDAHHVVGIGNIYANEALYLAGILPQRQAGRISRQRYQRLAKALQQVLRKAINSGGTTLRDFTKTDGQPGYFALHLNVYGKQDQPCPRCQRSITLIKLNQRSTYYCRKCQT